MCNPLWCNPKSVMRSDDMQSAHLAGLVATCSVTCSATGWVQGLRPKFGLCWDTTRLLSHPSNTSDSVPIGTYGTHRSQRSRSERYYHKMLSTGKTVRVRATALLSTQFEIRVDEECEWVQIQISIPPLPPWVNHSV
jgi:hypothetical protein